MSAIITVPAVVRSVDQNVKTILSSAWARRNQNSWWRRIVKTRPSSTKKETIQWLLETAKIVDIGNGGRSVFGDLMAANITIENTTYGRALNLTANDISDALGSQANTNNALDYAASWARHMGNAGAYWPQEQAASFMKNTTGLAYDGRPFFDSAHWVNPATKLGATYGNVFYGMPMTAANYATIGAYIETIPAPDGKPRKVKPRIVACGSDNRLNAVQLFGAESLFFTDPKNSAAPASNITKGLYETEAPIIDADLSFPAKVSGAANPYYGTWWIAAELVEDDDLAGMIFQEREPFALNSYTMYTDPELARMDSFEWNFKGRNAFSGGHPFLVFMCVPGVPQGKTQWTAP